MAGGADGDKPGLDEKLAVVEMLEGEDEAPTINVGDPAPDAEAAPHTAAPDTAALDAAAVRAEVGELRRVAGELMAALERLEARLPG